MTGSPALLFDLLAARTGYLAQRHAVLAANLANADTPGFRPNDLKPFAASLRELGARVPPVGLARTQAAHLQGGATPARGDARSMRAGSYEVAPSGNAVVIEEQMLKMSRTQLDYQLAASLYGKHVAMLKAALGAPGA